MPSTPQPKFQPWPSASQIGTLANSFSSFASGRFGALASQPLVGPDALSPHFVRWLYEQGFAGCELNSEAIDKAREERQRLAKERCGFVKFADVASHFNFTDAGGGQLIIPFVWQIVCFGAESEPGAAQQRGDCVSHAASGAERLIVALDAVSGVPDAKTGIVEGVPEVDPVGIKNGVTSSEWKYWWRGYNGDGWSCDTAATVSMKRGIALRNNYANVGCDFRVYSGSLAGKYGSRQPPANMDEFFKLHPVHSVVECDSGDEVRDALASGYSVQSCGGQGYSSKRDKWGYSPRSGSWSHGYKNPMYDDRAIAKRTYGEPLLGNANNWGIWNGGGRDIIDSAQFVPALRQAVKRLAPWQTTTLEQLDLVNPSTGNIMIPPGYWWCKVSEARGRQFLAYTGAVGHRRKALPNFGGSLAG